MRNRQATSAAANAEAEDIRLLVQAVEREFWRIHAGNGVISWPEAERYLQRILAHAVAGDDEATARPARCSALQPAASRTRITWGNVPHRHKRRARS